ncbi:hypothetical protein KDH_60050 [Dictyobacter sp. S3.2.2.5]|uniref:Uncharacterized protein n=1 Tax=Dictyobacter halimunensis TaxID=3026934 RepID=A0ABQ6FY25_9CHLR|nr:hypothetical protein KDH_60050 [Dictyobacter sp. S3.2.2.5]
MPARIGNGDKLSLYKRNQVTQDKDDARSYHATRFSMCEQRSGQSRARGKYKGGDELRAHRIQTSRGDRC